MKKLTILFVFILLLNIEVRATAYTWSADSTGSSAWNVGTNWTPQGIPDSLDNVTIVATVYSPELNQDWKVNKVTMTSGTLDLNGHTLTVKGTSNFNGGAIQDGYINITALVTNFAGTHFIAVVNAYTGLFNLSGSTFELPVTLRDTGSNNSSGTGGCVFEDSLTIIHTGNYTMSLGTTNGNVYNGPVKVTNYSPNPVYLAYSDTSFFNESIELNSTNIGGIIFGLGGGVAYLANSKTISIGSSGFISDHLVLQNFKQLGTASQTLTVTDTTKVSLVSCLFEGDLTITAPSILLKTSKFYGNTNFIRTGKFVGDSHGGNEYHGNVTISNNGISGRMRLATTVGDTYFGNATFNSNGLDLQVAYKGNNYFHGNILTNNSKVVFNASNGKCILVGNSGGQSLSSAYNLAFSSLTLNNSGNSILTNTTISVDDTLDCVSGYLITTTTNLLTLKASSKVFNSSNSSFISGPVKRFGASAFTFPIGKNEIYAPLSITATSLSTNAYTAEFIDSSQNLGNTLDSSINFISDCRYWKLDRNAGSANVTVKFSSNATSCDHINLTPAHIVYWNGTKWIDKGLGVTEGDFIVTSTAQSNFGYFAFGYKYNAMHLDQSKLCNDSLFLIDGEQLLLSFETDSNSLTVETINPFYDIYHPKITKLELYNGSPGNLVLVSAIEYSSITDDTLRLNMNGLNNYQSNNYYVRISSESNCDSCITDTLAVKFCILLGTDRLTQFVSFTNICGLEFTTASVQMNQRNASSNPSTGSIQPVTINASVTVNNGYPEILGAYLYSVGVGIVHNAPQATYNCTFDNGNGQAPIVMSRIALNTTSATCWQSQGFNSNTATYRADVTNLILAGNINYVFNGPLPVILPPLSPTTTVDFNGLSLIIVYRDCHAQSRPGNFYLYDGLDIMVGSNAFSQIIPFVPTNSNSYTNTWGFIGVSDVETANNTYYRINEGPSTAVTPTNQSAQNNFWNISFDSGIINNSQTFNQVAFNLRSLNGLDCISVPFVGMGYSEGNGVECSNLVDLQIIENAECNETELCAVLSPAGTYNYLWSTSETTACIVAPVSGTYTVTVTGTNICSKTEDITVIIPSPLTISYATSNTCNSPCNGSIDINVINGTAPYTYLWSNSSTTQDISGICTGTYTVTVTDVNGCTSVESILIEEFPTMNIVSSIIESCRNECNGSINLTVSNGTTPYSYIWSNSVTTEDLTNLCEGNYTVTVTDANGCTKSISESIIEEHPEFIIVGDEVNCREDNPQYTYSIINNFDPVHAANYQWSVSGGLNILSIDVTGGTATIGFPQYQGGSITVNYSHNGCNYVYTLHVFGCCIEGDVVMFENGSLSDICTVDPSYCANQGGTLVINTGSDNIVFNGTTFVDQKTLVINSHWGFGEGAAINTNGNDIVFENSTLRASCNIMWKGIQVTSTSAVELIGSTILDAQYGLDVMNGGSYNLYNGNYFDLNYVGIRVAGSNIYSSNVVTRKITGTTFDCTNDLLSPYTGQTPTPCSRSFAGMYFNSVTPILTVGDASFSTTENTFQNLNMGIYAYKSQLNIANCKFLDIRTPGTDNCFVGTAYNPYRGGAIVSIGEKIAKPASLARVRGFGKNTTDPNMFDNCKFGLNSKHSVIDIQNTKMIDMNFGVYTASNRSFEHNLILNNRIESTSHSIRVLNLEYKTTMKIYSNDLNVNWANANVNTGRSGIYASQPTPVTPPINPNENFLFIRNNEISIDNAQNGIRIDHVSWSDAINNNIYLTDVGTGQKFGIRINGLNYHESKDNHIFGSYVQSTPQLYGFQSASSINTLVQCNHSIQNNQGFRYLGNNFPTDFWANEMNQGDIGLNLLNGARMGDQINTGNKWIQPISPWGAFMDPSCLPSSSIFLVDDPNVAPLGPITYDPNNGWFFATNCSNCQNDCETNWDVEIPRRDFAAVAGDSLSNEWVNTLIWDARRNQYEMLLMHPEISFGDSILNQFQQDFKTTGIGLLSAVAKIINDGCISCNGLISEMSILQVQRDSMMQLLITNDSLLYTGISTLDSLDILVDNESMILTLNSVSNELDSLHTIINKKLDDNLTDAKNVNNEAINVITENIEFNEYIVNEIYFDIIINKLEELDYEQISILESIIWQCPAEGGKAVYRARTLYNEFVNDTIDFDDANLCALISHRVAPMEFETPKIQDFASISPVPASDFVNLNYSVAGNQLPNYQIHDVAGRLIMDEILKDKSGIVTINVEKLNPGVYYISIRVNNKAFHKSKMVIIK